MSGGIIATHGRLGKTQAIAIGASSAPAAAVGPQTYRVRLVATVACLISVTNDDASGVYLAPNFPEVFICTPGQIFNVVETSGGTAGTLFLTELE
jgi:hypothetical protein